MASIRLEHKIYGGALLIGVVGSLLVYWLLFRPAGDDAFDAHMPPDAHSRLLLHPEQLQRTVSNLAPPGTRWVKEAPRFTSTQPRSIPVDWVHHLPAGVALLFSSPSRGALETALFLREADREERFSEVVNGSGFLSGGAWGWRPPRLERIGNRAYLAGASAFLSDDCTDWLAPMAGTGQPHQLPGPSPALAEFVSDNRNGGLAALYCHLFAPHVLPANGGFHEAAAFCVGQASTLRITAARRMTDLVVADLRLVVRSSAPLEEVRASADQALAMLAEELDARFGIQLQGKALSLSPNMVTGSFTVSGYEALLKRALGR